MKPILLVDFDGVIHSYSSGWKGARVIPDAPVSGALQFLVEAQETFRIMIYSSRSRQWGGKRAMKRWLTKHYKALAVDYTSTPKWLGKIIFKTSFADPWPDEVAFATKKLLKGIGFPTKKPAAFLTLDDRAMCFEGTFPEVDKLLAFKPWNKR